MSLPLLDSIVYGPVKSRRLGCSLGINLLPPRLKVCTFNCAYCQYGWTRAIAEDGAPRVGAWPAPWTVFAAVYARVERAHRVGERIDRLTIAGHGEPTLHPEFEEVIDRLCALRDRWAPRVPLAILSNSTTAAWPAVRRALVRVDERYMKLDAGSEDLLRRLNGSLRPLSRIVDSLHHVPDVTIQAMFVRDGTGNIDNTTDKAVTDWLAALIRIHPTRVHLYTIDRDPAWPYLRRVSEPRLREIAERVQTAGIPAEVFA
ncbi:MAG: radical SAM protein [Acidobacteria bacterium]|nr:radical SAM protein [Acidobacteriota bacterium]